MEMNMDVRFNFTMCSYSGDSRLIGYAAEAIAEGFAFEEEGKLKQAFFSYFSAIDSFIEAEREKLNRGLPEDKRTKPGIRLIEKLQAVVKGNMPPPIGGLDKVKVWGDVKKRLRQMREAPECYRTQHENAPDYPDRRGAVLCRIRHHCGNGEG
ncbi:hypothetical protein A7J57_01205 [Agrobacterium tumefaciens]|uniref:Uncharacterized protein n=2 Tax=Agrobacterium tumefaciens TaxID=358 RepID=A0A176XHR1_AGRTU|nr:hypothetical protein A7J57_01205 [Agrobacterium tumefaciens]